MPVLFDSSVYIRALRGEGSLLLQRWVSKAPLWLSAVVLEELYAGSQASGRRSDFQAVARLERDFERAGRILIPNLSDWSNTGKILARLAQRHGYEQIGRARLVNDALIAASASRTGVLVLTANQRDFARLAEFCPLQWELLT